MFRTHGSVIRSLIIVVVCSTVTVAQQYKNGAKPMSYRISELDVTDNTLTQSIGFDLNDNGQIAGNLFAMADQPRGFFRDTTGAMTMVPSGAADLETSIRSLSSLGDVAGSVYGILIVPRAFRWNHRSGTTTLSLGDQSVAYGINSTGDAVGWYRANGKDHGFLWDRFGSTYDLGGFDDSPLAKTTAYAVNDTQQVAGIASGSDGFDRAFLWIPGSGMKALFPGSQNSGAFGISNWGRVCGYLQTRGGWRAFIYDTKTDQYALYGPTNGLSVAYSIEESGVAVGQSDGKAALFLSQQAFDLNQSVAGGTPWSLTSAYAINNNGQILVSGTRNGVTRAFLLTPIR